MSDPSQKIRPTRFHGRVSDGVSRLCESEGCAEAGEFRAPRQPGGYGGGDARDYRWLCLDHVRAFNAGYNYFAGMTPDEIEAAQTVYSGWERETRAFAAAPTAEPKWNRFADPADVLSARFAAGRGPAAAAADSRFSADDRRALKQLGLDDRAGLNDVRRAYADRVRRFHPDRNGGDRRHEQALQAAISAYTHLRKSACFR